MVADTALCAILAALGYPAGTAAAIAESRERIAEAKRRPPAMLVGEAGKPTPLPESLAARAELVGPDGAVRSLALDGAIPAIAEPGYYRLTLGEHELTLAIAPAVCPGLGERRAWGPAIQIPALRGPSPSAFGDLGDLDRAVALFAARGADAIAINPLHALFPGTGEDFSPYSPSSRLFLNGAMGDPALTGLPPFASGEGGDLIDWKVALPERLAQLRMVFDGLDPAIRERIAEDSLAYGEPLQRQALFDALDCHFRPEGAHGWRDWPEAYRDPASVEVRRFAAKHAPEIEFHLFVQWLARESAGAVQRHARAAGMAVGLIADLAVGVHTGGADAWSLGDEMLHGLTIGAPPDPLGPHGQNWGLTGFSPAGLAASGYAGWIAMLRAALASAGGVRIDHAFGLARLWVIPEGGTPADGAYLTYPFDDLLGLAVLEAHRAGAVIIAEDLGTAPPGFSDAIARRGLLGMRVLWFQRAGDGGFVGARDYDQASVAMTGTHDTATVAGWWSGRDLDWAEALERLPEGATRADADGARAWDRGLLWSTIGGTGVGDGGERPGPGAPGPVVEAALRHIGRTAACLAIAPLEDLLALDEQPNLPGTIAEHPNWRRRLDAPLAELLDDAQTSARIAALADARKAAAEDESTAESVTRTG